MKKLLTTILLLSAIWCNAQYLPATTTGTFEQGLFYKYQEGNYSVLPVFPTTLIQDTAYNFTLSKAKRKEYFAIQFEGYVKVPSDKVYTFYIKSDDGSKLWVDDILVVNNDGLHQAIEKSGTISLAAGNHKIKVGMFNATGLIPVFEVQYSSSTIPKKPIPITMLFRDKSIGAKPDLTSYTKAQVDSIIKVFQLYVRPENIKKGKNGEMDTLITN